MPGSDLQPYPALTSILQHFGPATSAPPDVLMFGDSVAERVSRHDEDKRTLAEMVAETLKPKTLVSITRTAQNPALYSALLVALSMQPCRPRQLIIPVNLRCFSPQWHLNPDWQLTQELAVLSAYHADRNAAAPAIADVLHDSELHEKFERIPVRYGLSELTTVGQFRDVVRGRPATDAERARRSREIFVFHYTYRIDSDHPKLVSLRECARLANLNANRALIYLTPINVEAAVRHVGPAFLDEIKSNVDTIARSLATVGAQVTDWSDALPEKAFFHEDLATEHLNQTGRLELAQRIAKASSIAPWQG